MPTDAHAAVQVLTENLKEATAARAIVRVKVGDILDTGFGWRLLVESISRTRLDAGAWRDGVIYNGQRWNVGFGEDAPRHPGAAIPTDIDGVL